MRRFYFHSVTLATSLLLLNGCSLYESAGRKAIEKNENGIVVLSTMGLSGDPLHYYNCEKRSTLPSFLKEPLEVIETEYESQGLSVMTTSSSASPWIAVYRHNAEQDAHTHCKVYPLRSSSLSRPAILNAARVGVAQVTALESQTQSSLRDF
jgi:hypothetical protein